MLFAILKPFKYLFTLLSKVDFDRVLSEVQSAANSKTMFSKLNVAVVVFSGPAGTGKTSACLAIQGKTLPMERQSTHGGDGMTLVVRVKKEELLGFEKPRDDLNCMQRALLQRLQKGRGAGSDIPGDDKIDLSQFVSSLGGQAGAMNEGLDQAQGHALTSAGAPLILLAHGVGSGLCHSPTSAFTSSLFDEAFSANDDKRGASKAHRTKVADFALIVPEQIQVKREAAIVMRAQQVADGPEDEDGVHTFIFDLGGQPEFWPLVGEFLRE